MSRAASVVPTRRHQAPSVWVMTTISGSHRPAGAKGEAQRAAQRRPRVEAAADRPGPKYACVGYASRKQHCIAMSSTEAEIIAASQAALEIVYMRTLLREMGVEVEGPTVLYVDNSGAVELSKHRKSCGRSRHVQRRYLKVRELVAAGEVEVRWIDTKENLADLLSKGTLDPVKFDELKAKIMNGVDKGPAVKKVKFAVTEGSRGKGRSGRGRT